MGQSATATEKRGTMGGTVSGTPSLKALARLVIERDRARDTLRDTAPKACRELSHYAPREAMESGTVYGPWEPEPPPWPPLGTPERDRMEAAHRALVSGLLAGWGKAQGQVKFMARGDGRIA